MQIPYNVSRSTVLAFFGRNARLAKSADPIHIIMERTTGMTTDCFVEFCNQHEGMMAIRRFEDNRIAGGRGTRLDSRHVYMELSSMDELMHALFPKAKNIQWNQGMPTVKLANPDDDTSGPTSFINSEELVMMSKHIESPKRVSIPTRLIEQQNG